MHGKKDVTQTHKHTLTHSHTVKQEIEGPHGERIRQFCSAMRKLEWLAEQSAQRARRMHANRYESGRATVLEIDIYSEREGNMRQPHEDRSCSSGG